jgi:hypothetical protein
MKNRASYGLKKQLSSRYLRSQTKCSLYKAYIYLWKCKPAPQWGKMKICSESLKEEYQEEFMAQLGKMVCGDQGVTTNYI